MDTNQERYFFLSGLISVSFFLSIVFLAGFSLILSPKVEQFAMIKSDVINVSISEIETQPAPQSVSEPAIKPIIQETPEQSKPEILPEKAPAISDLFAQVKPVKKPIKNVDDQKRNEQLNALEKEILEKKETSRFSDKVNSLVLAKPSISMVAQGGSTGPVVNEYHAKIQGLVYTYFRPPNDSIGQSARVRMMINADGKLISYKVIRYGSLSSFNHEVDWLKDRLSAVRFPQHPEGKDAVLEFILTAKEQ